MTAFDDESGAGRGEENGRFFRTLDILRSTAISDKDPLARKYALYMLGTSRDFYYTDIYLQSLYDPDKAVRSQAVVALVGIGDQAFQKVIPLLRDKDWKVRYRAAETLGMMKNRKAVPYLIATLSDEKDHVRYMAVKSLGLIGDPAVLEPLRKCQSDENPYVRKMVERVIIEMGGGKSSD